MRSESTQDTAALGTRPPFREPLGTLQTPAVSLAAPPAQGGRSGAAAPGRQQLREVAAGAAAPQPCRIPRVTREKLGNRARRPGHVAEDPLSVRDLVSPQPQDQAQALGPLDPPPVPTAPGVTKAPPTCSWATVLKGALTTAPASLPDCPLTHPGWDSEGRAWPGLRGRVTRAGPSASRAAPEWPLGASCRETS